ncbi:MAG TPA: glycosyltransferase family 2 protein [Acidimicrobiales bacterium]|nr:glycosyltransferase family 2 protein [Acidimicrobiales bacterium]
MQSPEALAPQVVAVIVACDPGEWFEEELAAFAAQDYPELSVLVLDCGTRDSSDRVAAVLPGAYVRRLEHNLGFGASANCALGMVQGASHFLFCHDDVAPEPDVVSVLLAESFRSNAGIVGPKLVSWEDPRRLLHVGMAVDKGGAVVDRVEPGELDHGQHDSVRDVFLAPGGLTLVRADLFEELGGFDPRIFAMGEDLDLCWRAQVAGARVIVAPEARVRHLELLASGQRGLPEDVRHAVPRAAERSSEGPLGFEGTVWRAARALHVRRTRIRTRTELVTLQSLQRRHELRAVLKDYGRFHRARVLPQLAVLSLAEILIAWVTGHRDRAAAVIHAWRWNFTERSTLREARAAVRATRMLDDSSVRRQQLRSSARLTAYLRRAVIHGMRAARLGHIDEPGTPGSPAEAPGEAERVRVARATRMARWVVWVLVAVVLVFGTRQLLGSGFPYVGQLLPFASWSSFLHHFMAGWQPSGVGTTSSATPGNGILGLGGLVVFGGVGLLQKIVVLGCIPVGAVGMARLVGGFGSVRARLAASVAYLVLPLPYDALATGRWDALLAYAASPWIVGRIARAASPAGSVAPGEPGAVREGREGLADAAPSGSEEPRRRGSAGPGRWGDRVPEPAVLLPTHRWGTVARELPAWRTTIAGRALGLGLLEALLTSLAPSGAVLTLLMTAGLALGTLLVGGRGALRAAGRMLSVGALATAVTVVLLEPWSVSLLSSPGRWQELAGPASAPGAGAGFGNLLHLGIGPIGDTPLAWGLVIAALLPLLIGAGPRLAWAGRCWVLAGLAWTCAWLAGRGSLGPLPVPAELLLVPAAVGVAMAVGLGVVAFEEDLPGYRFGWRQVVASLAAVTAAAGSLPFLAATLSGRWDLPTAGYGQATSWMAKQSPGNFRVLWLGDPAVLPGGAWQISPGLAFGLSENGLPDATSVWQAPSPGPASAVGDAIELTESARTVQLGQLLAPYAVRYVVVVGALAPTELGTKATLTRAPPPGLITGLASQIDLRQVISEPGFEVWVDEGALPERALRAAPAASSAAASAAGTVAPSATVASGALSGWQPVLSGSPGSTHFTGRVGRGTLYVALAPHQAWQLIVPGGGAQSAEEAFGFGASFSSARDATVTVRFAGSWRHGLAVGAETVLWIAVLLALGVRRRWFVRWLGAPITGRRSGRRRRRARARRAQGPRDDGDVGRELVRGGAPSGVGP